ncbi:CubicO group peptidase (beta-lactamase class C family) [Tenacibaculum adriaticum]|uniref:CubicO group peptidase (Beta-lactamase class C family) n=1 Tax=Tenacibaculum adriaticum TaxID=413713 RepID=A0A5S5DUG2_9FLAO|nr:serine hydrolase domain-containing protein [Tenacibaculum adriaticum]TYP99537.1 CubicO group peptidase (beta-lactamase class C family) [Tenacibaculum adriaticum]
MKIKISSLLLSLLIIASCSKKIVKKESVKFNKQIDKYISSLMNADEIPGLAIGVIQNGKIIHKKNYGLANLVHKVPVTDSTLFRVYSTSKIVTSIAIFQLIEDRKLSLDDSISKYIDNLPKLWENIKIEHLLTHSSGLPDYKKFDKKLSDQLLISEMANEPLHFEKGYRHEYNQTNFWFLKLIIEKVANQKFEDFIKENQFNEDSHQVFYASNSLVAIPNRVSKYQFNKEYNAYEISTFNAGSRSIAGNGLNINLNTLLKWNSKLDQNYFINQETKIKMLTPYDFNNQDTSFGYSWGIFGPQGKQYYGFSGGGVSALMKFLDKDLTIIILSNGFKNRPVISNTITYISGLSDTTLVRKDRMLNEDVRLAFMLNNYNDALQIYKQKKLENKKVSFERALNEIGYYYLSNNQLNNAISIFRLLTEEHSNSSNAFDSLAEAYFIKKQYGLAKQNYKKSLVLNPENDNAEKMLAEIEKLN